MQRYFPQFCLVGKPMLDISIPVLVLLYNSTGPSFGATMLGVVLKTGLGRMVGLLHPLVVPNSQTSIFLNEPWGVPYKNMLQTIKKVFRQ
jgi:hypothetical protein